MSSLFLLDALAQSDQTKVKLIESKQMSSQAITAEMSLKRACIFTLNLIYLSSMTLLWSYSSL